MSSRGQLRAGAPAASPARPAAASRRSPVQTPALPTRPPCSQTAAAIRASLAPGAKTWGEEVRKGGKKCECVLLLIYARLKPCAGQRRVLECDNAMEMAIPHQGRSLAPQPFSISSNWPVLGHWSSAH